MIESYKFGEITIDGVRHSRDLLILPREVRGGWWRREGHNLCIDDLEEVLRERPEALVIGTGYSGLMRVPRSLTDKLEALGMEVVVQRTREACRTYNSLIESGRRAAAALHLTC